MLTVKAIRKARKLTQRELARLLRVSIWTVQGWEQGRFDPRAENLKHMAETLHVNMEDLIQ